MSAQTTRRSFLGRSLAVTGLALAGGKAQTRAGVPAPRRGGSGREERVLVVVQLTGGNDALNTVVPVDDQAYRAARPGLALSRNETLPLEGGWSLHGAMRGLHRLFQRGMVAVVQGAGYAGATRSHFQSMDVWHTARPQGTGNTGWLGRLMDLWQGSGRAVAPGPGMTLMPRTPLAVCGADYRPVRWTDIDSMGHGAPGRALGRVSTLMERHSTTRVFYLAHGGYDTHVDQARRHTALLRRLDDGLSTFVNRLQRSGNLERVLVLVFSEFGRSLAENLAGGTDHGEAGVMFLIGPGVVPGLHGQPTSLEALSSGRPTWPTDFRRVYAAIIRDWFGEDPAGVVDIGAPLCVIG
jgi:uncharacterized protein (DUF1501 family)